MQIGLIGLGRMGLNLARNLCSNKHEVIAFDISENARIKAKEYKINVKDSIEGVIKELNERKVLWVMVPSGKPVDDVLDKALPLMKENDVIIDGGNSFFENSIKRAEKAKSNGVIFLDIGTSGGLEGALHSPCITVGGQKEGFQCIEPVLKSITKNNGYLYCGPSGSGHFVKMVHNGIEYAMMQALGEGFELLEKSNYDLNLKKIAEVWNKGSIIECRLLNDLFNALKKDPELKKFSGEIGGGETGRWAVETSEKMGITVPSIALALKMREDSKNNPRFAGKIINALRNEFGGHKEGVKK